MNRTFAVAAIWLLTLWLLPAVVSYSERWESQVNPTRNVTVELAGGRKFSGDLSTTWQGLKELRTNDQIITFTAGAIHEITVSAPSTDQPRKDASQSFPWRLIVGPTMLFALAGALASRVLVVGRA